MKGNQKVAKKKGVPNERRRLSLRARPSPIAKTPPPVVAEGSKKSKKTKKSKKSTQEREPSYVSLSVTDESERDGSESEEEMQPPQPLELYFKSSEFTKMCKIQTKCYVSATVKVIKETLKEDHAEWFTSHSQFRHFFHMPDEQNLKLQGMWMLLLHAICTPEDDVAWFAVNGVPIRYSMREHALISGLDCTEYPSRYKKIGGTEFVNYYFHNIEKITITDVEQKLLSMPDCPDKLKMAVLFFLGTVIRGKAKYEGHLDAFILRMVDDLDACRTFPWGRLTFEDSIKEIKRVMNHLKGEVKKDAVSFPGFIVPLEVLAFECIPALGKEFRIYQKNPCADCPRMCKSRFTKTSLRGYPLQDIYRVLGDTKTIHSVLEPTIGEEMLLARIVDLEREYDRQGSPSETWNHWLTVKGKSIWWEELYDLDQAARVFTKKKDKEKVTSAEASSSDSSLQGLEQRLLDFMGEAFVGLNLMVETKLEAVDLRLGGIEKEQRLLRSRAKKIDKRLTSIENKVSEKPNLGEDMDFGQWDHTDFGQWDGKERVDAEQEAGKRDEEGEKEKEDVEQEARNHDEDGEKEKENRDEESGTETDEMLEQLQERSRVQADAFWKKIAEEEEREKEKKIAEEEKGESESSEKEEEKSGDEERVEESEAEEDEKVEEEENVGRELAEEEEKEKEKEMSGDEPAPCETPTPPPRETPTTPKKLKLPPVDLNKNPVEEEEFGGKEVQEEVVVNEAPVESEKLEEVPVVKEYTEEEKQSWVMVVVEDRKGWADEVREAVTRPEILLRCKEKTETYGKPRPRSSGKKATPTAGPKKRGRPRTRAVDAAPPITGKRKSEPSQWVQTPFTAGKKGRKKTKTKA